METGDVSQRKLTCSVETAAKMLGISRCLAYQEARKGELAGIKVIRVGKRMVLPLAPLERMLAQAGTSEGK